MIDVIPPKRSSHRPRLIEATMFLKLNMSLIPSNPTDVAESPIWNTLIPSRPELLDDIDDSDDNENDEDNEEEEEEDDDQSPVPVETKESDYTSWF